MSWIKLSDDFFSNKKIVTAGRDARDIYLAGLAYAGQQLTDGYLPTSVLPLLAAMAGVGDPADAVKRLEAQPFGAPLWERVDGGWLIHDYLEYNPTRAQVLETRATRSDAGRRGGATSRPPSKTEAKPKQNGSKTPSKTEAKSNPVPVPVPVPVPGPDPGPVCVSPALETYREIMGRTPNDAQTAVITHTVTDQDLWEDCVRAWKLHNYRSDNIPGILDWYEAGGPPVNGKARPQPIDYAYCSACRSSPCTCGRIKT